MCTPIAANTASATLLLQAALMGKLLAVGTIVGVVTLHLRGKLSGFVRTFLRAG